MKLLLQCLFFLLLVSIPGCRKDSALFEIHNLNNNKIGCFGHGGMGIAYKYPIDCYESLETSLRIGADGTEIDIQLTKDSVLVAFHSTNLFDATLCEGIIRDKNWSEIWGCHFTSPLSYKLTVTSIDEVFKNLEKYTDKIITFDCKLFNGNGDVLVYKKQFVNAILKTIEKNKIDVDKLYIESQDTTFLRLLQSKRNDLRLFIYPSSFEEGFAIAKEMKLYGITISNRVITKEQIALAHEQAIRVTLWNTQTDGENSDAVLKNPDYIQSDRIIHLLKVFSKYKS